MGALPDTVTVRPGTGRARRIQRFSGLLLGEWRHPTAERRVENFSVYRSRKGKFVLHVKHMPDWAAWSDPDSWREWHWDETSLSSERWEALKRGGWWSGPTEETLEVFDNREDLRDRVPAELFELLSEHSDRPAVEELDI
jgi:EXLDI family protein